MRIDDTVWAVILVVLSVVLWVAVARTFGHPSLRLLLGIGALYASVFAVIFVARAVAG